MLEKMKIMLSKIDCDYADIRFEEINLNEININTKDMTYLNSNKTSGFVLRVLKNGGLGQVTFTDINDFDLFYKKAIENALLVSTRKSPKYKMQSSEIINDVYYPIMDDDPANISIEEKIDLLNRYNNIPLGYTKIASTNLFYLDLTKNRFFVNSEGSSFNEKYSTSFIEGGITAKDGSLTQNIYVAFGSPKGFKNLKGRESDFEHKTKIVTDLLKAEPVKGGKTKVLLDQDMGGVFIHEAFGHFSEADLIEDNVVMREKMRLGAKIGSDIVNIIDDPTINGIIGHYKFDDEGVRVRPVQLMKEGVLCGRLHSRRTASAFGEPITGHCVAQDYRFAPIVRMGNIYIENGNKSFDQIISGIDNGLYLLGCKGGQTSGENYTFGAQYGYEIKNGKIGKMVREINLSGNLYSTMLNIREIANDLKFSEIGGCGKNGQHNMKSCYGSPHILINDVTVGGQL